MRTGGFPNYLILGDLLSPGDLAVVINVRGGLTAVSGTNFLYTQPRVI